MLSPAERQTGQAGDAQEVTVASSIWSGSRVSAPQIEARELGTVASKLAELATDVPSRRCGS